MTSGRAGLLTVVLAFAAGITVGIICGRDRPDRAGRVDAIVPIASDKDDSITSDAFETNASTETGVAHVDAIVSIASDKDGQNPETTVEVTYADASDEPSPEVTAAHGSRRAKRAAARRARAEKRSDFLSSLNPDLLTADQRKLHAEYAEAVATRDSARAEILALRAKGEDAPPELQRRLADAESVVRADAADEHRLLREAAARARGLDEDNVRALLDDLASVDSALGLTDP